MKNISDLRNKLTQVFEEVHTGSIDAKRGQELANIAGKIIATVSVELKACEVNKTNHRIAFLMDSNTK